MDTFKFRTMDNWPFKDRHGKSAIEVTNADFGLMNILPGSNGSVAIVLCFEGSFDGSETTPGGVMGFDHCIECAQHNLLAIAADPERKARAIAFQNDLYATYNNTKKEMS